MGRRKSTRSLTPSEQALWTSVAKKVTPLPETPALPVVSGSTSSSAPDRDVEKAKIPAHPMPPIRKKKEPPKPKHVSMFDAGDPRQARRVARGKLQIDATLDLHGMTQVQAEKRLQRFVEFAHIRHDRVLLIITGKGPPNQEYIPFDEAPRGILRRRFLEWVEQPPLRHRIASVQVSHQKHGGNGAFYIFLKNTK